MKLKGKMVERYELGAQKGNKRGIETTNIDRICCGVPLVVVKLFWNARTTGASEVKIQGAEERL